MKKLLVTILMIIGIVLLPTALSADITKAENVQPNTVVKETTHIPETGEKPKLSLPFNTISHWTSVDPNVGGIDWQTGNETIMFAIKDNKFTSTSIVDTWFVYGWFGPIEAIQKPYNIKYPLWGNRHNGIDFVGRTGLDITSASNGTVTFTGNKIGKTVIVDIGNGYRITYGHLLDINVRVGDIIETGDVIGHLGNTGTVNPHLHFEVDRYIDNQRIAINPLTLMNVNWNKVIIPNTDANRFYKEKQNPLKQLAFTW